MAHDSFDRGPTMPLTAHLADAGLGDEGARVAKLAFEIARLALGAPNNDSPLIEAIAKSTIRLAKAGERNPDVLAEKVLAQVRTHHPENGRKLSVGEMIARMFKAKG
jgi:hypothetical protein